MEQSDINPTVPNGSTPTEAVSPAGAVQPDTSAPATTPAQSATAPAGTPVTPIMARQPVNPVMPTPVNPVITPSG